MKRIFAFVFAGLLSAPALAAGLTGTTDADQETAPPPLIRAAEDMDLSAFLWQSRPVIVFADSTADPRFIEQMQLFNENLEELALRDVVVLTDTDPAARSPLRMKLRPRGFMMVLVGKDGGVKLRKPLPWSVRELSRVIDKMPIRQQEIRDRRASQ